MTMRSDHDLLIQKLDAFTRKYYKDRLIRGGLYSVGLAGARSSSRVALLEICRAFRHDGAHVAVLGICLVAAWSRAGALRRSSRWSSFSGWVR